jgi:hypothetical protein
VALVVVPVGAAVTFAVLRVTCEMVLDYARLPHVADELAAGLLRIEDTVDGVAEDMPRIAFLRGPRRRDAGQPPSAPTAAPDRLQA